MFSIVNNFSTIKEGILSSSETVSEVLFDCLDVNQTLRSQTLSEVDESIHLIDSLLSRNECREKGLRLLQILLTQHSFDGHEEKLYGCLVMLMKFFNGKEIPKSSSRYFEILATLSKACSESQDLSKKFANTYLSKMYDMLEYTNLQIAYSVLSLLKVLLEYYPGPSIPHASKIEKFLKNFFDYSQRNISEIAGQCWFLVAQTKSSRSQNANLRKPYLNYQNDLIIILDTILDHFLMDSSLETKDIICFEAFKSIFIDLHEEPSHKISQLYAKFSNVSTYLNELLRAPYNNAKVVLLKKILNLIQKGLAVTPHQLLQTGVLDKIVIASVLPKIQLLLLTTLDILIKTIENHLKMYAYVMVEMLVEILKWTSPKNSENEKQQFSTLRIKAYAVLCSWMTISKSGSVCETFVEPLISEIFADCVPLKDEMTLKVMSGARKHLTKKARKLLQMAEKEQSNINKQHSKSSSVRKSSFNLSKEETVCQASLMCLNEILKNCSNFIKHTIMKTIYTTLLQNTALLYEVPLNSDHLYYNVSCRQAILSCLHTIVNIRHQMCPAPMEIILATLQIARYADPSLRIRVHCANLIGDIEKLIHPPNTCLLYPTDMKEVKNAFIVMRQERQVKTNNFIMDTFQPQNIQKMEMPFNCINNTNENDTDFDSSAERNNTDSDSNADTNDIAKELPDSAENSENLKSIAKENRELVEVDNTEEVPRRKSLADEAEVMKESLSTESCEDIDIDDVSLENLQPSTLGEANQSSKKNKLEVAKNSHMEDTISNPKKIKLSDDIIFSEIESEFVDELA